jgi:transposase InsO family protein
MDKGEFDPYTRDNNKDEISLFTFDIINSLGQRQKDFLIHARLAHLPRKAILQLIKNGATGLPYKGKFRELCRPCLESRQRAENHGKQLIRHPNGKFGEHLHSDLAIVNIADFKGFKYVLTVVDEISDEVIITLLKSKSAEVVLAACKNTHKIITARCKSEIKTWQFDRGSEFLNSLFEEWITRELGASQLFSNIEHPWENGRAMLKYADLPNALWGKALVHAAYLKNRSPSTRLNLLSPLQFRTGEAQDFTRLRVFGCPAQIFVRATKRENNKLSDRSEKGTLIGMSTLGNGYIFRIQRTNQIVDIDSRDAKFNETFSDCMDKKGRRIKGGKVLDPDLFNEGEMAYDVMKAMEAWNAKNSTQTSRFSSPNQYEKLSDDEDDDNNDDESSNSNDNNEGSSDSESEDETKFSRIKNRKTSIEPIKIQAIKSRAVKNLLPSKGFQEALQKDQSKHSKKILPSSGSKSKRASKPPERFEPNFEATQKRRESTFFLENEDDDLTDLDPTVRTFDQLLSCLEQGIGKESGKLDDPVEDLLKSQQNIGGNDPKSQKAIDKMPPEARKRYNDATTREYEGMKSKEVMEFVRMTDIPKNAKIYICIVNWTTKFVLGVYQKTKCRICFGGHHYVKTFTDCFAPTVNFCSVLIMLCLAAMFGWFIGSLDYAQAYLNADIDEECFLRAPEFLREYDSDGTEFIWRLKKVIYGHPKGSRLWAECLHEKLKQLQFKQLATDQCVYAKWVNWDLSNLKDDSYFVFVLIHSDDLIILSNKKQMMLKEKSKLLKAFEGVDQGTLKSFCGVEIDISENKITLSMRYYWKKVMQRFGTQPNDKGDRPLKSKISKDDCPKSPDESRKMTYLQIIGSIIFGFTHCRLDLAFPVGMLTRVMHSPNETHLKQLMDLLKYINATMDWGLNFFRDVSVYYGMVFIFLGFCDSSHADDPTTSRSTGGYFFFLRKGQGCICSKSGQTPDIALSSTEAETIWACMAATQGAFIKQFLDELKIFGQVSFELMEDSQPAINAQRKNVSQSRFRHIKIKWHYIRQLLSEGWCKLVKINTKNQIADMATKILTSDTVEYFSKIVLGSVAVDQSLHVHGNDTPYNDWGVVSEPYYHSS